MREGPCQKFTFDVYEREIERYGGPVGIEAAKQFFCADSTTVVEMLALLHARRKGGLSANMPLIWPTLKSSLS